MEQVPEIMRKSKRKLFAYVHSHPQGQVMGVTIDGSTGKTIEATILPTRQRVMLALGIGNEHAHAHNSYRQKYGRDGYVLFWSDDPHTDERLADLRGELRKDAQGLREAGIYVREGPTHDTREDDSSHNKAHDDTEQITTELVRRGAEAAKQQPTPAKESSAESLPEDTSKEDKPIPHGGFF